jgi:hypothetical protein
LRDFFYDTWSKTVPCQEEQNKKNPDSQVLIDSEIWPSKVDYFLKKGCGRKILKTAWRVCLWLTFSVILTPDAVFNGEQHIQKSETSTGTFFGVFNTGHVHMGKTAEFKIVPSPFRIIFFKMSSPLLWRIILEIYERIYGIMHQKYFEKKPRDHMLIKRAAPKSAKILLVDYSVDSLIYSWSFLLMNLHFQHECDSQKFILFYSECLIYASIIIVFGIIIFLQNKKLCCYNPYYKQLFFKKVITKCI